MPNSLDRRITQHGTKSSTSTTATTAATTSSNVLSSSENKPSLPVKRSKSMKSITKPVSLFFSNNSCVAPASTTPTTSSNNNKQLMKSHSVIESYEPPTRSDTFPKNSSVTRFDFENLPVNLPRRESAGKDLGHVTESAVVVPPPKPVRSNSEYANVFVQGSNPEIVSAESVRNRISNYVSNNKASLSKPDSSNSLNDDAKKMLKDCQDYLVRYSCLLLPLPLEIGRYIVKFNTLGVC